MGMSGPVDPLYGVIGAAVRAAREACELSQEQVARKVGLTRTSITNLELGRQQTPLHVLYGIADAINVALKDLIPDRLEERPPHLVEIGEDDVRRWAAMVTSPQRRSQ